ncbi:DUF1542 domain-containing protein, partial [Staphylococcus aureus]
DVAKGEQKTKAKKHKAMIEQTADATTEEREQEKPEAAAQSTKADIKVDDAQPSDDVRTAKA